LGIGTEHRVEGQRVAEAARDEVEGAERGASLVALGDPGAFFDIDPIERERVHPAD
jgi:hypothetical protein